MTVAASQLSDYTEEGTRIVLAEVDRRQLAMPKPPGEVEANAADSTATAPTMTGTGGWLGLFCVGLLIIAPLGTVVTLAGLWSSVSILQQAYDAVPGLQALVVLDVILSIGIGALAIAAGVQLVRVRTNGLWLAAAYLGARFAYVAVMTLMPYMFGLSDQLRDPMVEEAPTEIARASIFMLIWVSYLRKSKRVLATYGRNL